MSFKSRALSLFSVRVYPPIASAFLVFRFLPLCIYEASTDSGCGYACPFLHSLLGPTPCYRYPLPLYIVVLDIC